MGVCVSCCFNVSASGFILLVFSVLCDVGHWQMVDGTGRRPTGATS